MPNVPDILVVGGGIVGLSIAYGAARQGAQVAVLDESELEADPSHSNSSLIWVQGKAAGGPAQARWRRESVRQWSRFDRALCDEAGIGPLLQQPGGFFFCFSDEDLQRRGQLMQALQDSVDGDYPFEMLDRQSLKARLPEIGPEVVGASFTAMDGQVDPAELLRALRICCQQRGVVIHQDQHVGSIRHLQGTFQLRTATSVWRARKIVLAAGLDNRRLAAHVGMLMPVFRQRGGRVLLSQPIAPFLPYPTNTVRQFNDGSICFGDAVEDAGLAGASLDSMGEMVLQGLRTFPHLGRVHLTHSWQAPRIGAPDGSPVWQASQRCPGAYVVTGESSVTLAAAHAMRLAPWIVDRSLSDTQEVTVGDAVLDAGLVTQSMAPTVPFLTLDKTTRTVFPVLP
ncbi:NAD(P)/FAD-dependent oxidoreductase [Pigmentiphaga aceris]|nr:FAD-dependent oxidoreductase [Pigmentiphaga aceris]